MSLETERILLESKINGLKRDRESSKMEGEMFVTQIRNELTPYLEFDELDVEKAQLAFNKVIKISGEIKDLNKEIRNLEKKLGK